MFILKQKIMKLVQANMILCVCHVDITVGLTLSLGGKKKAPELSFSFFFSSVKRLIQVKGNSYVAVIKTKKCKRATTKEALQ